MEKHKVFHTCLNCGRQFHGDFCPACGQAANTGRFTFSLAVRNLFQALTSSDNTFLSTAVQLFYRPGHLVRDFICGRRVRYFRPIQMLLFLVTLYVLVSYFIDGAVSPIDIFSDSSLESNVNSSSLASAIVRIGAFLSNKVTFSLVAAILFTMPFHLVFKRCRIVRYDGGAEPLNAAEHFYALIYVCCQIMITSILTLPLGMIDGMKQLLMSTGIFVPLFFIVWTYSQLYKGHFVRNVLLTLVAVMMALLCICLLVIVIFGLFYGYDAVN